MKHNVGFLFSLKRNQNPSSYYYNSMITNLKFQHKPKLSFFKNPHIKINLLINYLGTEKNKIQTLPHKFNMQQINSKNYAKFVHF